jgi:hypothetical protein
MPQLQRPNDPRVPEILKHLRILARRHDRRLVVQDYLEYRAKHAPQLPALTTVYRLLGSWPEALVEAGVEQNDHSELSRTSDESLIAALKQAADALDVQVLSSHAYDEYRKTHAPNLPSSSVIRKWLGRWAQAVKLAGLETTERSTPRRPTMAEIIDALRQAKMAVSGMLTPRSYADFHSSLDADEREMFPDVTHILSQFSNWEAALRAADVEQSDALHPNGLWTAEEARRIAQQVERIVGEPLTEESYMQVVARASRPMPSWTVMEYLLSS